MGLLDRWRESRRIAKAGAKIARSLGGPTDSKARRALLRHLGELYAEAEDVICRVQNSCDSATRAQIAKSLYRLVLESPRGYEGYRKLYTLDQHLRAVKDMQHCAPWLARLLVLADHLCEQASGDGLYGNILVAEMQGCIERFMSDNGTRGWGVSITNQHQFDLLRTERPIADTIDRGL